jgi:outer membrane protein assembly factor BamB
MTRQPLTVLLLLVLALAGTIRADDWPQQGGTPDRTGALGERAGPPVAGALWDVPLGDELVVAPVVADGVVILCAGDGTVRALDERSGAVRWVVDLDAVGAAPACGLGRVVVVSGPGRVTCLALEDGVVVWDRPGEGGGSRAALAVTGGVTPVVLVNHGFPSRVLEALDLRTGARRWGTSVAAVAYSAPCVAGGLVVTGADDGGYEARDLATGSFVWRYSTTGAVLTGGPTAGGGKLFLLPGGDDDRLHVIDPDSSQWGSNLTVQLVDPSAPTGWQLLGTTVAPSVAAWTGRDVVLVVRFDHVLDTVAPFFTADTWESHEYAVAVDPATATVRWQVPLASLTASASHELPPFQRCPPPVVVTDSAGAVSIGFASSLEARLEWRDEAGALGPTYAQPGRWSNAFAPALANGRVVLAAGDGRVVALPLAGTGAPDPATITTPSGTTFTDAGALAWTAGNDPDDPASALVHTVRLDDDGEVLLDWAFELTPAAGSTTLPLPAGLAPERTYTARIRTRDPQGATSSWSAPSTVRVTTPVEAVRSLSVVRTGPTTARAEWQPSPTSSVARHVVTYRPITAGTAGPWSAPIDVGLALLVDLTVGDATTYEVSVVAVSGLGRTSPPALASVDGQPPITIGSGGSTSGPTFYALGQALAAARAGDVVILGAGTFRDAGPLTLAPGVTLRGAGPHRTRIAGVGAGDVLRLLAGSGARVERLTIFAGDRGLTVDAGADVVLEQLVIRDAGDGLTVGMGARAVARNLTIVDGRSHGVLVLPGGKLELASSLVLDCTIGLETSGDVTTLYCSIAGKSLARLGHSPSPTDRLVVPLFVDRAAFDLREAPGSPTIDAGDPAAPVGDEPAPHGSRVNLGAFGGTDEAATSTGLAQTGGSRGGGGGCALAPAAPARSGWPALLLLAVLLLRRRRA